MKNQTKPGAMVPNVWHPISAIKDSNRYEPSYLLHCPDLIDSDFNPEGVVEGHWCDDEGWQAAVWCGYHDEFHTKFVTPTKVMVVNSPIGEEHPPSVSGAPEILGYATVQIESGRVYEIAPNYKPFTASYLKWSKTPTSKIRCVELIDRAHVAPLLAEIERLKKHIEDDDRILRSSVPEQWKQCTSAVGAVQGYIAELEDQNESITPSENSNDQV